MKSFKEIVSTIGIYIFMSLVVFGIIWLTMTAFDAEIENYNEYTSEKSYK